MKPNSGNFCKLLNVQKAPTYVKGLVLSKNNQAIHPWAELVYVNKLQNEQDAIIIFTIILTSYGFGRMWPFLDYLMVCLDEQFGIFKKI